jgi:hypothetical protein
VHRSKTIAEDMLPPSNSCFHPPDAKSSLSTSATFSPRLIASSATPVPVALLHRNRETHPEQTDFSDKVRQHRADHGQVFQTGEDNVPGSVCSIIVLIVFSYPPPMTSISYISSAAFGSFAVSEFCSSGSCILERFNFRIIESRLGIERLLMISACDNAWLAASVCDSLYAGLSHLLAYCVR